MKKYLTAIENKQTVSKNPTDQKSYTCRKKQKEDLTPKDTDEITHVTLKDYMKPLKSATRYKPILKKCE